MDKPKAKQMQKSFQLFLNTQLKIILKGNGDKNIKELKLEDRADIIKVFVEHQYIALAKIIRCLPSAAIKNISIDALRGCPDEI